jgi:Ribbon-helix-helix protein, copG family
MRSDKAPACFPQYHTNNSDHFCCLLRRDRGDCLYLQPCATNQITISYDLAFHMKTTLNISERLMAQVKEAAARQRRTMSEFIESALRLALQAPRSKRSLTALPTFSGGTFRVNVADQDALLDAMEER